MEKKKELVTELVNETLNNPKVEESTSKRKRNKTNYLSTKVLLLGGNGFIGNHLRTYLEAKGYKVYILDIQKIEGIDYIHCNLNDLESTKEAFSSIFDKIGLENLTIFHMASTVGPNLINIDNSINDFKIHFNVYEALKTEILKRQVKPHKLILMGSSESYGDINIMDESKGSLVNVHKEGTRPLYALQKLTAENIFLNQGDYDVICTRLFNVVGKGQREDFIIPRLTKVITNNLDKLRNCSEGFQKFQIHGVGSQSRNFISVFDAVAIFELLINYQDPEEFVGQEDYQINNSTINISCIQNETTIIHLVHKYLELFRTIIHNGVRYIIQKENSGEGLTKTEQESLDYLKYVLTLENKEFIEFVPGLIGQEKRSPLVYKLYKVLKYRPKKDLNTIINEML